MAIMEKNIQSKLISIIVPVYNVSTYLNRCVDTLISQTYQKIEILLIDDGSTDGSGDLCDRIALYDDRIRVVHKDNGGLSDARNVGIRQSRGDFLTFVDSDDWVSDDYIEVMVRNMENYDADISGCFFQYVSGDIKEISNENIEISVWSAQDALRALLQQDGFTTSAWGLLIKKEYFKDVLFPKGKYYEDLGTMYKLIHKAKVIVHTNQKKYFYYKRYGSIQNEKYSKKHYDELIFIKDINIFIKENYPDIEYAAIERLVGICFHLILMMNKRERKNLPEAKEMLKIIDNNRIKLIFDRRVTLKVKGGCILSFAGIWLLEWIYLLFGIKGRIDF